MQDQPSSVVQECVPETPGVVVNEASDIAIAHHQVGGLGPGQGLVYTQLPDSGDSPR